MTRKHWITCSLGLTLAAALAAPTLRAAPGPANGYAITGAMVFDGTGAPAHAATVLIRDGRIAAVGANLRIPAGTRVIDARGKALLPGFFDLHTHWTPGGAPALTPAIATAYVKAGVTTVDDFNAAPESYAPRRQWLGTLATPHVRFAARISTPGGHGADWADTNTTKWVNTPEGATAAVNEVAAYKPDLIKAFTDGWRYGSAPDNTSMNEDTLAAITAAAHKNGLKVFTHTVTQERGAVAARAHVDVLTHSLQDRDLDAATIALLKASGIACTPTLAVYEPEKPGRPPVDRSDPKARGSFVRFDHALHNVKALHDAGVTIALGTDAGMPATPHGSSTLREMELLVRAGLTPAEALVAGTADSARVAGLIADRGTIQVGKRADLVLVDGKPWETISDVRKTDRVFIDGKLVFGAGAAPLPAANAAEAPPPIKVAALVDDFERADGRSSLDTLRTDDPDGGLDRTVMISEVIKRDEGNSALTVTARMAAKKDAWAGAIIPLSRGSIQPVDATGFKGVRFEIRGDGAYQVRLNTVTGSWTAPVQGGAAWRVVEVPFSAFKPLRNPRDGAPAPAWRGDTLTQVEFGGTRPAGTRMWMQIDNVRFY